MKKCEALSDSLIFPCSLLALTYERPCNIERARILLDDVLQTSFRCTCTLIRKLNRLEKEGLDNILFCQDKHGKWQTNMEKRITPALENAPIKVS